MSNNHFKIYVNITEPLTNILAIILQYILVSVEYNLRNINAMYLIDSFY